MVGAGVKDHARYVVGLVMLCVFILFKSKKKGFSILFIPFYSFNCFYSSLFLCIVLLSRRFNLNSLQSDVVGD